MLVINAFSLFAFIVTSNELMLDFANVTKYNSLTGIFIYFLFTLAFIVGSLNYKSNTFRHSDEIIANNQRFSKLLIITVKIFAFITIFGYLFWFKDVIIHFKDYILNLIYSGMLSSSESLKEETSIKTLTNFGIGSVILSFLAYKITEIRKFRKLVIFIIFLSLFRVFFTAERVALLELIIPIGVIVVRFEPKLIKKLAMLGVIFLIIIWSTELLRSYMSPMYNEKYGPFEYLFYRFSMYFSTSINNFQILLYDTFPKDILPITGRVFYKFLSLHSNTGVALDNLLTKYGSEEYNNFTAWGELFIDFGYFGIIIAFFLGRFCRLVYNSFIAGRLTGLYLYPLLVLFFIQSFRTLLIVNIRYYASYLIFIFFLFLLELANMQKQQKQIY
jgi:oligosaccharide repeat unit polymerase